MPTQAEIDKVKARVEARAKVILASEPDWDPKDTTGEYPPSLRARLQAIFEEIADIREALPSPRP